MEAYVWRVMLALGEVYGLETDDSEWETAAESDIGNDGRDEMGDEDDDIEWKNEDERSDKYDKPPMKVATEVFSWESGANYQLGPGNAHRQKLPCKYYSLHGPIIKLVSIANFRSVAIITRGELYTWGLRGGGGQLGHLYFDIHSLLLKVIHHK